MPNYKQAPKLYHNKDQFKDKNFYQLPQELMDRVFNEIDGRSGNQIKLMTVLLGTLGNGSFGVSEKWICDRTGMVQQTYNTARKALVEKGWIYLENGKIYVLVDIVRYGFPYPDGATVKEKAKIKEDTISNCVNKLKQQYHLEEQTQFENVPQAQYEIVDRHNLKLCIINNTDNEINNNGIGISSLRADSPIHDVNISGEIDRTTAKSIVDVEWISPQLILTTTGKYFRVKD